MKKPNRKQRQREIAERNRPAWTVCVHCQKEMPADSIYLSHDAERETIDQWLARIVGVGDTAWGAEAAWHAPNCVWVQHRGQLTAYAGGLVGHKGTGSFSTPLILLRKATLKAYETHATLCAQTHLPAVRPMPGEPAGTIKYLKFEK